MEVWGDSLGEGMRQSFSRTSLNSFELSGEGEEEKEEEAEKECQSDAYFSAEDDDGALLYDDSGGDDCLGIGRGEQGDLPPHCHPPQKNRCRHIPAISTRRST